MATAAFLLSTATSGLAHEDPPGCFRSGPAIVITVLQADGTTPFVGNASECETIAYQVTLKKAFDTDELCAFSGGTLSLTTPDGVVHEIETDVPCVGGTTGGCDSSVDAIDSIPIIYTVRPEDVAAGLVRAVARYAGGIAHDRDENTPGVSAESPKTTPVALCDDGDACTQNVCDPGAHGAAACSHPPVDCDDENACTTDTCAEGTCSNVAPDPTCVPCDTVEDCDDRDACTVETCTEGICLYTTPDPDCEPCGDADDCEDDNACTTDTCTEGICTYPVPDPTCVRCETAADCDDADACTTDTCPAGACVRTPVAGCPSEVCDDLTDNDGDGAIDCADPDCEGHPSCRVELCNNCLDDDGDGHVDYEDADCCDATTPLALRRLKVRTKPGGAKTRLRLKARYAAQAPDAFDPSTLGSTLLLRDDDGLLYCHAIPFKSDPTRARFGIFKFKDKTGELADGLRRARFKIRRKLDGRVSFRAKGKKMSLRDVSGSQVLVTLRVGAQCTQATASLRTKRARVGQRLVYP